VEICIFCTEILIEGGDEEYLLFILNYMTFGNMSQKLWPTNTSFVSQLEQSGQIWKNLHFDK